MTIISFVPHPPSCAAAREISRRGVSCRLMEDWFSTYDVTIKEMASDAVGIQVYYRARNGFGGMTQGDSKIFFDLTTCRIVPTPE